jgi:hypothetical protein
MWTAPYVEQNVCHCSLRGATVDGKPHMLVQVGLEHSGVHANHDFELPIHVHPVVQK